MERLAESERKAHNLSKLQTCEKAPTEPATTLKSQRPCVSAKGKEQLSTRLWLSVGRLYYTAHALDSKNFHGHVKMIQRELNEMNAMGME